MQGSYYNLGNKKENVTISYPISVTSSLLLHSFLFPVPSLPSFLLLLFKRNLIV